MNIKAEKKMRIQAYHYRDGMLVKDIAKEVGISQAIVRKYLASVDEQLASGEIKKEDIISSCDALGIDRPKKVRKAESEDKIWINEASSMTDQQVDEMIAEQGMTQQELSENVQALDEILAKADSDKQPTSQREFVLGILGYLYDDLVAGNIKLSHYIMENGMHELQFTEVEDDHSNRTGR